MQFSFGSYTEYVEVNGYIIKLTFERREDVNLAKACVLNDLQGVKDAVEIGGANVNAKDPIIAGRTILAFAAAHSSPEITKYLIEKGAEINITRRIQDKLGHSHYMMFVTFQAFNMRNFETLDVLIRAGADFDLHYFNAYLLRLIPFEVKEKLLTILKNISDDHREKLTSQIMLGSLFRQILEMDLDYLASSNELKHFLTAVSAEEIDRINSLRTNLLLPLHDNIINSRPVAQVLAEQREQEAYRRISLCVSAVAAIAALSYYASPLVAIGATTCLAAYATYKCFSSDIAYNFIKDISIVKEKVSEKAHSFVEAIKDSGEKAISFVRS